MTTGSKKLAKKKVARMLASAEGVRLLSSCVSGELVLRARRAMPRGDEAARRGVGAGGEDGAHELPLQTAGWAEECRGRR